MQTPFEDLSSGAKEYLELKDEDLKLGAVEGLSVGLGRIFALVVMLLLLMVALTAFTFGFVLLLGNWVGSYAGGAFIMGGIQLAAIGILFIFRKKLFVNMFVKLLISIVYDRD